ncbi:MAG: hypothetical protein WED01_09670 [Candidatus Rokuibacteriota bacterium]
MRLGCGGCLAGVLIALGLAVLLGAAAWGAVLLRQAPDVPVVVAGPEDSARAQQKVFQLVSRGRRKPAGPVVFTEAEVNALVSRQLAGQLPLSSPVVKLLAGDSVELFGRVPARRLLVDSPLSWLSELLPAGWGTREVWLRIRAHATVEAGARRRLRFEPSEFAVGRLPLPTVLVRLLLDPGTLAIFRWSLPEDVEAVTIEPGRATIRVASSR